MARDNDSEGFEAGMRRWQEAWQQAMAAGEGVTGGGSPWRDGIEQWTRLFGVEAAPKPAAAQGFRQPASDWLGAMQELASRFAGRDTSAAEIAAAWRETIEGQGDAALHWLLEAARGGNALADQPWLRDVAQAVQSGFGNADWLKAPAFGPAREHQARWQALLRMQHEHQARIEQYVATLRGVLDDAVRRFEGKLGEREAPGSQLTSARAMFDLWIDAAEEAYATVAMSEEFQSLYAELANAQMRLRAASQHEVERACEVLGLPTRTEMDAAHRRITELERQVRRLLAERQPAAATAEPAAKPAARKRPAPKAAKATASKTAGKAAGKAPAAKATGSRKPAATRRDGGR